MAHVHEHRHNAYYLDQLCTLGTCGAIGVVSVLMYVMKTPPPSDPQPRLSYILAPQFFLPVLFGGIALIVLVLIRGVGLWREAGTAGADCCGHDHDHGHDHGHGHDHEHGWTPAKYAVLLLPVVLYFLNLPNSSFNPQAFNFDAVELSGDVKSVADKGSVALGFKELTNAALDPRTREELEGKTGSLKGMFSRLGNDKVFTLYRVKMTCCAADAIPLGVRIFSPENITGMPEKQWVEVSGQIQFHKLKDREKYMPVMVVKSADDVKKIPPEPEYDY